MSELRFEWDPAKAASNLRKHGISFEDAQSVFYDEHGLLLDDPDHSAAEERFILLGLSPTAGVLGGALLPTAPRRHPRDLRAPGEPARARTLCTRVEAMRKEYDFTHARPNPYAKRLKQSVTIRLEAPTIEYFKGLAKETGIPYQTLINLYLRDCATARRKPALRWASVKGAA